MGREGKGERERQEIEGEDGERGKRGMGGEMGGEEGQKIQEGGSEVAVVEVRGKSYEGVMSYKKELEWTWILGLFSLS